MKRKGFTLVELLVVIAIIALLMGVLMPALARVRQIAYRMICGTNLSGIGKAMMLYANDNDEEYPRAGGRNPEWVHDGEIENWKADGLADEPYRDGRATITSCFYLLIKYSDSTPKQFICKGDDGAKEFKLSDFGITNLDYVDVWDFGDGDGDLDDSWPGQYCSYSYHIPFNEEDTQMGYPVDQGSKPASPLCADRNPYFDESTDNYRCGKVVGEDAPVWETTPSPRYSDEDKTGNAAAHQREGQNVLFNDIHVSFEKYPNVGIENDNIWRHWPSLDDLTDEKRQVDPPCGLYDIGDWGPLDEEDAWLVNEWKTEDGPQP